MPDHSDRSSFVLKFRSTDDGQTWEKVNNANGHIFVEADFVGGAGGVYRSTDTGRAGSRPTVVLSKLMFERWQSIQGVTFLQVLQVGLSARQMMPTIGAISVVGYSLRWKCLVSENRFEHYAFAGTAGAEYSAAYNQQQQDLIRSRDLVDSAVKRIAISAKSCDLGLLF